MLLLAAISGLGAMLTHRLLIGGAGRRTLAERWFRHAVELPTLNRFCRGMGPGNKPDMA